MDWFTIMKQAVKTKRITKMKWITEEIVHEYVVDEKTALDISLIHWHQNKEMSFDEAKRHVKLKSCPIRAACCGLCRYHRHVLMTQCRKCPLRLGGFSCYAHASEYDLVLTAWNNFRKYPLEVNFERWTLTTTTMFTLLLDISPYTSFEDMTEKMPINILKYI